MTDNNQDPMNDESTIIDAEISVIKAISAEGRPFIRVSFSEDLSGYDAFAMLEQAKFIIDGLITAADARDE